MREDEGVSEGCEQAVGSRARASCLPTYCLAITRHMGTGMSGALGQCHCSPSTQRRCVLPPHLNPTPYTHLTPMCTYAGMGGMPGGGYGMPGGGQRKDRPIEQTLMCTLEELAAGSTRKMKINRQVCR